MNKEETKITVNKILAMIYWLYKKDLKSGITKDGMLQEKRQSAGKSAKKAKTFQQTALMLK